MDREPSTPAERIRWAVEQSGLRLVDIAEHVGCTHSALSYWQTGATRAENIKAMHLLRFCEITGASPHWLMSGDGPRLTHYAKRSPGADLIATAEHVVRDLGPEAAAVALRLLRTLDPQT